MFEILDKKKRIPQARIDQDFHWKGVREAEGTRLEIVCTPVVPWVRIPPFPPGFCEFLAKRIIWLGSAQLKVSNRVRS